MEYKDLTKEEYEELLQKYLKSETSREEDKRLLNYTLRVLNNILDIADRVKLSKV